MTANRKRIALAVGVAVVAAAWLSHAVVLRRLAGLLVADEPADGYRYVCLVDQYDGPDGDWCFDVAADLYRRNPSCRIVLVESHRDRTVQIGAMPSFETLSRRELESRGLPQQAMSTIRGEGRDDWAIAKTLRKWLAERPHAAVVLLSKRFRTAHVRYVLDAVLDPAEAARVRVRALPGREYDETDWWTSRSGIKAFGFEWLRQLHGWYLAGDHRPVPYRSADDYQRSVLQTLEKAAP
jgi:hypothetical protein